MVFDGLGVGGIEKVGATYSKLLSNNGHDVTIINLQPHETKFFSQFDPQCKYTSFFYPRSFVPERYEQIVKNMSGGQYLFPVICLLLEFFNVVYKLLFILLGKRKKYDLVIAFSGHFNDLSFVSRNYLISKQKMCWLHGALYQYLLISSGYLKLYKSIKNLVVLVDDCQNEVFLYNNCKLNIKKIYNPIKKSSININETRINKIKDNYGKFIMMVARFSYPHKDQYTVIKAFKILVEKYNVDFNLVFVGDGPELPKVKSFVKDLNKEVSNRIFFAGERDDVENYYQASFALVHSSIVEGLPTVLLEALRNNVPVVSTDSKAGAREILGDNRYGLLCKVGDPNDMAQKINELNTNSALRQELILAGSKRIDDFLPERIYNLFIDFYKSLDQITGENK